MRSVRVHLDHDLGTRGECVLKSCEVRSAETLLSRAMENADPRMHARELFAELAGAIGRCVIHDEE
jgi:hypothetical protein